MSGWPFWHSYHVLTWFNGDPPVLPEDDARRALGRMPPMCLVPLVMKATDAPQGGRAA